MKNRRNYYRLLQVQPDAPLEVIKASYRTLMQKLKYHPDLGGDEWNAALLNEAYAVLCDPAKRAVYDREEMHRRPRVGPQSRTVPSTELDVSALPPRLIEPRCPFCGTRNTDGPYQDLATCNGCGGPLQLIAFEPNGSGKRGSRRIEQQSNVEYIVKWPPPTRYRGTVINLSPTGLRFVSDQCLIPQSVIKLDTKALTSIARVTHCLAHERTGLFATGVHFLTLGLHRPRGSFVSESA